MLDLLGGEAKIGNLKPDGLCGNDVYLFSGCVVHGHITHMSAATVGPFSEKTFGKLYKDTMSQIDYYKKKGYNVIHIWECEFDKMVKTDEKMRTHLESVDFEDPLECRDALFGGRTNAIKLSHKAENGEKIKYVDVCSLYPYVNKYGTYPVGSHEVITNPKGTIHDYFGVAKVKVIAPKKMYLPVLPYRYDGKLQFPLCHTCVVEQNKGECKHTDNERAMTGTWVTSELEVAIKEGYKIEKIYEVWHYKNKSQYDKEKKYGGIFSEYVNTFLKIKQECSGWPAWVKSEEDKDRFIDEYYKAGGVKLDKEKICHNPGLRALSKLSLNSL